MWDCNRRQIQRTASSRQLQKRYTTTCNPTLDIDVSVTVCQTSQLLKNCATLQMTSCLTKPYPTSVMFCTPLCHHHPQRLSTTISCVVHTPLHFPNTLPICQTVTLSLGCCTNTVIKFLSPVFTFLLTFTSQS